jgi:alcohol dehydrogenase
VFTTVSTPDKAAKAKALGADHVINYKEERFEGVVRKLTGKQGVDVVFEHVGPDTFQQSMFAMKRGGVLVTCGSTTGVSSEINLFQLYQRQLRFIGSFGCNLRNLATVLDKMAAGIARPVIDSVIALADIDAALGRLESRNVFGKILVTL